MPHFLSHKFEDLIVMSEEKIDLSIEGMTCNHCASTVSGIISQEGGQDIHVDYLIGEANFMVIQGKSLEKMIKRLDNAGYASKIGSRTFDQDEHGLSNLEWRLIISIPFSLVLFSHMFFPPEWSINNPLVQLLLCLPVFTIGVIQFGKSSLESLKSGNVNMDVLIFIGSTSAFFYSIVGYILHSGSPAVHDYLFFETASTIVTLVLLGYVIEHRAVKKTTTILKELIKSKPERAKMLVQNGLNQDIQVVLAAELQSEDLILINTGDRIPADGVLLHGNLQVDESMLTGESSKISKSNSDELLAGSVVVEGSGTVRLTRVGNASTIGKIIELVKKSRAEKPPIQKLADRISAVFVPAVLIVAVMSLLLNYFVFNIDFTSSLMRTIAILVIACPCAMGLATPTAVSVGLGMAGRRGIILKQASVFEELNDIDTIVFDKTGTLTTGEMHVALKFIDQTINPEKIWSWIKSLEINSTHPIAQSLVKLTVDHPLVAVEDFNEDRGNGVQGKVAEGFVKIGSADFTQSRFEGDLFITLDNKVMAIIYLEDQLKEKAVSLANSLSESYQLEILSGDRQTHVSHIASVLGITKYKSDQLPEQKLQHIKDLKENHHVLMVGDGVNDSPALQEANIGLSMGTANALASQSSKVVILNANLENLSYLIELGKRVVQTIRQNLFWAFAYNVIAIPLAAMGFLNPMVAALSMAFSDVIVIGNSLRLRITLR